MRTVALRVGSALAQALVGAPAAIKEVFVGKQDHPDHQVVTHIARCRPMTARGSMKPVAAVRHPQDERWWVWQTPVIRATLVNKGLTGEQLRDLRAERGVGRPPSKLRDRLMDYQANRPVDL